MTGETMVPANGVDLCVQWFGAPPDPPVLLIADGRASMDWWDDDFCARLAAGGRWVIRYDQRNTGRSSPLPPHGLDDLAADALGLLETLDAPPAHLVGYGLGGLLARRVAATRPDRVASLVMIEPPQADTVSVPVLVLQGTPGGVPPTAELVRLDGVGPGFPPPAVWPRLIGEILRHTG